MTSAEYLYELNQIFKEKEWNKKENYSTVLDSLLNFYGKIIKDPQECKLLLDLLKNFHWISFNEYYGLCNTLIEKFINSLPPPKGGKYKIYLFPIIKEKHEKNTKSGHFIIYIFKALISNNNIINNFKVEVIDLTRFSELKNLNLGKNEYLALVDDFIGSGETLTQCIDEIRANNPSLLKQINILTLFITKTSLNNMIYPVFYNTDIAKGITDFYIPIDAINKTEIMKQIENRIFKPTWISKYSLGYDQQECLINLLRCPDNTFPIFWGKYKKTVLNHVKPPFPRHNE